CCRSGRRIAIAIARRLLQRHRRYRCRMILLVAASAFRRSRCPCRSPGSRSSGRGLLAGNLALAGRRQLRYALDLAAPLLYLLLEQKGGPGNAFLVWLRLAG